MDVIGGFQLAWFSIRPENHFYELWAIIDLLTFLFNGVLTHFWITFENVSGVTEVKNQTDQF